MKKQFKAFWLALVGCVWLLLMAAACHKTPEPEPNPEPDLPPITQTGEGTIGCYINGKPWVPKPYFAIGVDGFLDAAFNPFDNRFFLQSIKKTQEKGYESSMSLTVAKLRLGENMIDTIPKIGGGWAVFDDVNFRKCAGDFLIDTLKPRRLTVTRLDTFTTRLNVVSGTFEFTAYNNCGDTLKFTKGRFDTTF